MKKIFSILLILSLTSCNSKTASNNDNTSSNSEAQQKIHADEKNPEHQKETVNVKLDSFSSMPNEIEGCSCSFYLSKKEEKEEKYIFVNDFAQFGYVSINGKIEKFILKEHQEGGKIYLYSNGAFDLKIKITKEVGDGDEGTNEEGTITLVKGSDIIFEKNFIGSCGC